MTDSESDNEFEDLFRVKEDDEDVFYFENMTISEYTGIGGGKSQIDFKFSLSHEIYFASKIVLNQVVDDSHSSFLFSIGMCSLTWYWMGFATKRIIIEDCVHKTFQLTPEMISFWQHFYRSVLLEFFYLNRMKAADITLEIVTENTGPIPDNTDKHLVINNKVLLPLGGGKDSLVTWHLAVEQGYSPVLMYVTDGLFEYDQSWRLQKIVQQCDNEFLLVRHEFHDDNLQKYCRSYLAPCGHPWAALVYFDAVLMCVLNNIPTASLGLELSADEGNGVFIDGVEVNHQYDKSSEFLKLAGEYVKNQLNVNIKIESVIKHMWELEITRIFCTEPRLVPFHPLFISCNEPINQNTWCAKCAKCAFMFLLLSAWLPSSTVVETIFNKVNMFEDNKLLPTFENLIGCGVSKPFDCVGTVSEAKAAIHMCAIQYSDEWKQGILSEECCVADTALPIVLHSLCTRCGIDLDSKGCIKDNLDYQQVYTKWELH